MKLLIIAVVLLSTAEANQEPLSSKVVGTRVTGGYSATSGLVKCYIALVIEDEDTSVKTCGGCLLPRNGPMGDRILTSAGCLFSAANGKAVSLSFYTDLSGPAGSATRMKVVDVYKNVLFNPANNVSGADIAQVVLEKTFSLSSVLQPAFPSSEDKQDAYVGEELVACGHGHINNNRMRPGIKGLQCTTLRVVPVAECGANMQKGAILPKGVICTRNNDARNVCNGDQGSPVFSNKTGSLFLVGIVSFYPDARANARCEDGHYSVITQVGYHSKFVNDPTYIPPEALTTSAITNR